MSRILLFSLTRVHQRLIVSNISKLRNVRNFQEQVQPRLQPRISEFDAAKEILRETTIYKNENIMSMWKLQGAAIANFIIWVYLVSFAVYYLQSENNAEVVKKKVKEGKIKAESKGYSIWQKIIRFEVQNHLLIGSICFIIGIGGVAIIGGYATRNINRIILRPGKKGVPSVSLSTYTFLPSKFSHTIEVPLTSVSCVTSREHKSSFVTLKVKGKWMFYLIDKSGTFINPYLFDRTIGLKRSLK